MRVLKTMQDAGTAALEGATLQVETPAGGALMRGRVLYARRRGDALTAAIVAENGTHRGWVTWQASFGATFKGTLWIERPARVSIIC